MHVRGLSLSLCSCWQYMMDLMGCICSWCTMAKHGPVEWVYVHASMDVCMYWFLLLEWYTNSRDANLHTRSPQWHRRGAPISFPTVQIRHDSAFCRYLQHMEVSVCMYDFTLHLKSIKTPLGGYLQHMYVCIGHIMYIDVNVYVHKHMQHTCMFVCSTHGKPVHLNIL